MRDLIDCDEEYGTYVPEPRGKVFPTVDVKCVICDHKETIPLTQNMPACSKCYGPVVVTSAAVSRRKP